MRREDADKQQADDYDKHIRAYVDQGYEARIKSRMEFSTHPAQLGFCVMDLDGDGVDELLVGENGYIVNNKRDGGTQYIIPPTVAYPSMVDESSSFVSGIGCGIGVGATYMHLCEDNVLAYVYACTDGSMAYHFARLKMEPMSGIRASFTIPVKVNISENSWLMCESGRTETMSPLRRKNSTKSFSPPPSP